MPHIFLVRLEPLLQVESAGFRRFDYLDFVLTRFEHFVYDKET
jgi:hypothetical protein